MKSVATLCAALLFLGVGAPAAVRAEAPAPPAEGAAPAAPAYAGQADDDPCDAIGPVDPACAPSDPAAPYEDAAPADSAWDPGEEPAASSSDFGPSIYGPCSDASAAMPDYCFAADATPGPVPPFDPFALWRGRSGGARFDGQTIFAAAGLKPQDLRPAERDPRPERFSEVALVRVRGDLGESGKAWAFEGRSCGACISLYLIYEASTAWHVEVVTIDPAIVGPGEEQLCTWPNRYYNFSWQCWIRPRTILTREPDDGVWQRMHQAIFDIVMDAEPHPWSPSR